MKEIDAGDFELVQKENQNPVVVVEDTEKQLKIEMVQPVLEEKNTQRPSKKKKQKKSKNEGQ